MIRQLLKRIRAKLMDRQEYDVGGYRIKPDTTDVQAVGLHLKDIVARLSPIEELQREIRNDMKRLIQLWEE